MPVMNYHALILLIALHFHLEKLLNLSYPIRNGILEHGEHALCL